MVELEFEEEVFCPSSSASFISLRLNGEAAAATTSSWGISSPRMRSRALAYSARFSSKLFSSARFRSSAVRSASLPSWSERSDALGRLRMRRRGTNCVRVSSSSTTRGLCWSSKGEVKEVVGADIVAVDCGVGSSDGRQACA